MWQSLPQFGTVVLYAILVAAAYTFAVSLAAGAGRPRLLSASRYGAYGTIALVGLAVLTLSYAFVSNDFRLSYVSRYSDRGMSTAYLFVALWGGQDGSWLWWLFLTSLFSGICIRWMGRRYIELQPYVIATLMSIVAFDAVLLIFAVSPFAVNLGGAPLDGEGLNYQLRNFYMIIHPPSLYIGFTSCAVPFSFCVAALVTGRLDSEWINATRKWMVFSWLFLTIGNVLGMMWAYEELGWGGDWAWDPVENAACLPWWTASAYVHSTMIQERRGMLKVWNVILICATFWLTIFGTFLTRSGLISSVHSFAKSNIGNYFFAYMGVVMAVCVGLIVWRLPKLRSEASFESVLSRETAFVLNNWALLGCGAFIAVATTWPMFSDFFLNYKSAVGPTFYNFWLPIPLVLLLALMCIAPLMGWRKTSPELLGKSFFWPGMAMCVGIGLHLGLGGSPWHEGVLRMRAFVASPNLYPLPDPAAAAAMDGGTLLATKLVHYLGASIAWINGKLPLVVSALASFKLAVVIQEFARGIRARQSTVKARRDSENLFVSLLMLVWKSRRRYGGYIVHLGVVLVYIHFAGRAWTTDVEASIPLGESLVIDEAYTVKYVDTRRDNDTEKMVIISDLLVIERGEEKGHLYPAKFIYKSMRGDMSTEVARHITLRDDLYVTLAHVDPKTKIATFQFHVNPFAVLLVIGAGIMLFGAFISLFPDLQQEQEVNAYSYVRAAIGITASIMFCAMLVFFPRVFPVQGTGADPAGAEAEWSLQLQSAE